MPHQLYWAILLLPIFSFVFISFVLKPLFPNKPRLSGYCAITAIGLAFVLSLWAFFSVRAAPHHKVEIPEITWVVIENGVTISLGLLMNSLTVVMLLVVTLVSLMVQIYSQGYMKPMPDSTDFSNPGYHRYYAFMSLFTASMLGLVLANSLLFMYVFWEGVGLCSYLLIGFWFHRPSAANAAKKAFIVTRLGDVGFLLAILLLYSKTGTTNLESLEQLALAGTLSGAALTWAALGIFSGAAGKSAQFPLHVWLPDAMEGPTPVSALIHAATMVAAGVFLVARTLPLFEHSEQALFTVALVGGFTAIFAASMGLVMNDIKRVVAYSTISQLGYMMLGLGVGGVAVGMFHLFNHAFFKALLFLGSGSVNHATGTFDMRQMGGLKKHMPWTYYTFLIAALSLAGIWPLSGFWSKDEILAEAQHLTGAKQIIFYMAMVTVFMTAFYIFRVLFLTFHGENRASKAHNADAHGAVHLHESPPVMLVPMVVLAALAIFSGWFNVSGGFSSFMGHEVESHTGFFAGFFVIFTHPLPWIALLVALLGIFLAYAMYGARWISAEAVGRAFSFPHKVFSHKYYFDELYERGIVVKVLQNGLFRLSQLFDTYIVDGVVNGLANLTRALGGAVSKVQSGQLQSYGLAIVLGVLAIVAGFYFFG